RELAHTVPGAVCLRPDGRVGVPIAIHIAGERYVTVTAPRPHVLGVGGVARRRGQPVERAGEGVPHDELDLAVAVHVGHERRIALDAELSGDRPRGVVSGRRGQRVPGGVGRTPHDEVADTVAVDVAHQRDVAAGAGTPRGRRRPPPGAAGRGCERVPHAARRTPDADVVGGPCAGDTGEYETENHGRSSNGFEHLEIAPHSHTHVGSTAAPCRRMDCSLRVELLPVSTARSPPLRKRLKYSANGSVIYSGTELGVWDNAAVCTTYTARRSKSRQSRLQRILLSRHPRQGSGSWCSRRAIDLDVVSNNVAAP